MSTFKVIVWIDPNSNGCKIESDNPDEGLFKKEQSSRYETKLQKNLTLSLSMKI